MSKHSDKEARIVAKYLEQRDSVEYEGFTEANGHYVHNILFQGQRVSYSHGGQRPNDSKSIFINDAERGVMRKLVQTNRAALADQWRNSAKH